MQAPREWQFRRFCSYEAGGVLGASVQEEWLYVVQPLRISVFQYHGHDQPQLAEELIHNRPILHYAITPRFICVRTRSHLELRDRRHWENVLLTYPLNNPDNFEYMALEGEWLLVGQREEGTLRVQKVEVESGAVSAVIELGRGGEGGVAPLLLGQVGMLSDFYIWARSAQEVELGMLYTSQGTARRKFEINRIHLPQARLLQLYHHRVHCAKYPAHSPEYVLLLLLRQTPQPHLALQLCEIVPRDPPLAAPASDFHGQFQNILNQFSFLKNLHEKPPSSLVQEVFSEAIEEPPRQPHFEVPLESMLGYQNSFYQDGKLWISSERRVCEIELMCEESIEVIVKSYRSEQRVIRSVRYTEKPPTKQCIAVYQNHLLFTEPTLSFELAYQPAKEEEIEEEIEEYEVNDEILEKEGDKKIANEVERLRNDVLLLTVGINGEQEKAKDEEEEEEEKEEEGESEGEAEEEKVEEGKAEEEVEVEVEKAADKVMAECFSQTELQPAAREFGTQTIQSGEPKPQLLGLEQIQQLVAKYSSAFTVSCGKVKQNSFIKEKFDRELTSIVEVAVRESVKPFLEARFVSLLEEKVRQITQHISDVFESQLEGLNELMRKAEIKENNLRGRRIFELSSQVAYIRDTVTTVVDALRASELHRHSFHALILDQAQELRQDIVKTAASLSEIDARNQASEKEIGEQVGELMAMVRTLEERQRENAGESSSSSEASESEEEQREVEETSEEAASDSEEDAHYRQPQQRKGKKSQEAFEQGYQAYPTGQYYHAQPMPPQMPPYYFPYMPQPPSLPMPAYYRPYPPTPPARILEEVSKLKKPKNWKKSKKETD